MKKFLFATAPLNPDVASLLLRLTIGILAKYGYIKIENYADYVNTFPDPIGMGPWVSVHLVIFAEVICSLLIALGLFTRVLAIPIVIEMCIVYFVIHADHSFDEAALSLLFGAMALVIFFLGSGKYSLDHLIQNRRGH